LGTHPLRVGIAGLGFGSGVHLPVFSSLPGVTVQAVFGRNREKTAAAARRFDVPAACTSADEFFAQSLDAVVICLPPLASGDVVDAALDLGLPIMCEKPIAATAEHARRLATRGQNTVTIVDFEFRELASFQALHALIAGGSLGKISGVKIVWRSSSYAQRNRIWSWKTSAAEGGGVLTLSGLHLFNLLEWLFGPVVPTAAKLSGAATNAFAPSGQRAAADTADLRFSTQADASIVVHLSNAATDRFGHRWEIETDRGRLVLDDGGVGTFGGFTLTMGPFGKSHTLAADPQRDDDYRLGPVSTLARRFLAAAREGRTINPDFGEGARAQAILEQIRSVA